MTDFSRLRLRKGRKQYLVAPPGHTVDPPHRAAPAFAWPIHRLAGEFRRHALAQPGIALKEVSVDGRLLELVHRGGLFKISTRISAQFLPLDEERSTLAVYSRTRYGTRSANRQRIDKWLKALAADMPAHEPMAPQLDAKPVSA